MFPFLRTEKSELIGEIRDAPPEQQRMVYLLNELVMVLTSFPSKSDDILSSTRLVCDRSRKGIPNEAVAKVTRIGTKTMFLTA